MLGVNDPEAGRLPLPLRLLAGAKLVRPAKDPMPPCEETDLEDARHWQRALWRSRRGMLELDLLLTAFAKRRYPQLAAADRAAYLRLLARDDWEIWDWLQGAAPAPGLAHIVRLVAEFNAGGRPA